MILKTPPIGDVRGRTSSPPTWIGCQVRFCLRTLSVIIDNAPIGLIPSPLRFQPWPRLSRPPGRGLKVVSRFAGVISWTCSFAASGS